MAYIERKKVPVGAQLRVWVEPNTAGDEKKFQAKIRMWDNNQIMVWDDEDITLTEEGAPISKKLARREYYYATIRIFFGDVAGTKTKVFSEIIVTQADGSKKTHGKREMRVVSSSAQNNVAHVILLNRMQKVGGA